MSERLDLRTIRALPYSVIGMSVAIIFEMIGIMLDIMTDDFMLTAEFLIYISFVGVFFCTYRLADRNRWMQYASVTLMCYILISSLDNILLWVYQLTDSYTPLFVMSEIASALPDIFLILGIAFLIRSVSEEYKAMDRKEESANVDKLNRLWIIAQVADMIVIDMILDLQNALEIPVHAASYIIIIATAVLYTVTLVWVCICIRRFCYELYIYTYNSSRR